MALHYFVRAIVKSAENKLLLIIMILIIVIMMIIIIIIIIIIITMGVISRPACGAPVFTGHRNSKSLDLCTLFNPYGYP